jgi:catechol 2,3-dioxygenase-like lactoylglutathione lyase family enzyme
MRLATLTLSTHDLERARAFYAAKLGFQVIEDDSQSFVVDAGGVRLHVDRSVAVARAPLSRSEPRLVFDTDELTARCHALRDLGISVEGPRQTGNGAFAQLSDPDGHPIELWEK